MIGEGTFILLSSDCEAAVDFKTLGHIGAIFCSMSQSSKAGIIMRFPAQEVIFGALLTTAAFAMGVTLSSAGAAHGAAQEGVKYGEYLTAFFTAVLGAVTYWLFKATNTLAASAGEDSRNRKVQATADAWWKLRAKLDFSELAEALHRPRGDEARKAAIFQLGELEGFCQIVNSGVFDHNTFSKMSGGWFVKEIEKVSFHLKEKQKENSDTYKEIIGLGAKIQSERQNKSGKPSKES